MPIEFKNSSRLKLLSRLISKSALTSSPSRFNNRRLIIACELLLVVLSGQQLAKITWQLLPVESTAPASWKQDYSKARKTDPSSSPYPELADLYLFGKPLSPEEKSKDGIDPDSVPRSRLSARITGIVASSVPDRSLAIISFRNEDRTYRIGDTLRGANAEIIDIYPDRVIVRNNGQHEAFLLYPNNPDARTEARPVSQPIIETSVDLSELSAVLRNNPASIADLISISPVRKDGKLAGYRINPRSRPDLFKAAGLENNDIALAINGIELTNNLEAMKLLQELPELEQISLTIERQGQIYQIDLSS